MWGQFQEELKTIEVSSAQAASGVAKTAEDVGKVLEELLVLARQQSQTLISTDGFRPIIEQLHAEVRALRRVIARSGLTEGLLTSGPGDIRVWLHQLLALWTNLNEEWAKFFPTIPDAAALQFMTALANLGNHLLFVRSLLLELPPLKPPSGDFTVGGRVFHKKFGYGSIADIDGKKLAIHFDVAGDESVMENYVEHASEHDES